LRQHGTLEDVSNWFAHGVGSNQGSPAFIDLEKRHPSSEEDERVAERFKSKDEEVAALTPEEYKKYVHPNLWRRIKQFWGL
jgi:hypothetical protein